MLINTDIWCHTYDASGCVHLSIIPIIKPGPLVCPRGRRLFQPLPVPLYPGDRWVGYDVIAGYAFLFYFAVRVLYTPLPFTLSSCFVMT